jgi:hypothetical protein
MGDYYTVSLEQNIIFPDPMYVYLISILILVVIPGMSFWVDGSGILMEGCETEGDVDVYCWLVPAASSVRRFEPYCQKS